MKKLSLGKLKLASEEVIQRSQLATIYGGSGGDCPEGSFACSCNGVYKGCYSSVQKCYDDCK